ncbi:NUDIX domain-containing protein [Candidatus Microgenomates bacterium]|nr:NUDIX domain-containing protein [Candidatus Microgenomates bacterium]
MTLIMTETLDLSATLEDQIQALDYTKLCPSNIAMAYRSRLLEGKLTRDENAVSHFCVYFLPYDAKARKVFIGHHKKANLWLAPGGHIDAGENINQAAGREVFEELGLKISSEHVGVPFLLTITQINNPPHLCKSHFDIWIVLGMAAQVFPGSLAEFHETGWLQIGEAKKLVTDPANLLALEAVVEYT